MEFCELAAKERDPEKLIALVMEINRVLQAGQPKRGRKKRKVASKNGVEE
jgi:hypothetical protein